MNCMVCSELITLSRDVWQTHRQPMRSRWTPNPTGMTRSELSPTSLVSVLSALKTQSDPRFILTTSCLYTVFISLFEIINVYITVRWLSGVARNYVYIRADASARDAKFKAPVPRGVESGEGVPSPAHYGVCGSVMSSTVAPGPAANVFFTYFRPQYASRRKNNLIVM